MFGLALFFKDDLGVVFLTNRNFVAGILSVSIIALSYIILIFPSPIEPINQVFAIFSTVPFMLVFFGGGFMLFLGLLIEVIILFFVIRAFLPTQNKNLDKNNFS
ncbi:hypothetical protein [Flavobacterium sp. YJ01]|uniref:hypothetical protein n=1 Tax=unclassified Flavobacterium TaxID=196869 RepID=UPI0023E44909|nr:hypothetical protein [Flavobacterium sp. YJ01]WET03246.1 hypothetical protein P0R33_02700 [Flavobacterium sp. YJ01]